MAFLSRLVVNLTAETATFQADLGRAAHMAEKASRDISRAIGAVGTVIGAIGVGAMVGEFKKLADQAIHTAASLDDFAERTGSSVENLSALKNVADVSGTSFETVVTSIDKFAKGLAGLDDETKGAGQALAVLGINATDSNGQLKDAGALVREVAQALDKYQDGLGKSQIIQALFGKGAAQMNSYFKDLVHSGDDVVTTTTAQASAAEEYEKQVKRTGLAFDAFIRSIVLDALPAMMQLKEMFKSLSKTSSDMHLGAVIGDTFIGAVKEAVIWTAALVSMWQQVSLTLGGAMDVLKIKLSSGLVGAEKAAALTKKISDDTNNAIAANDEALRKLIADVKGVGTKTGPSGQMFSDAGFEASRKPSLGALTPGGKDTVDNHAQDIKKLTDMMLGLNRQYADVSADDYSKRMQKVEDDVIKLTNLTDKEKVAFLNSASAVLEKTRALENSKKAYEQIIKDEEALSKTFDQQSLAPFERLSQIMKETASYKLDKQREDMILITQAFERSDMGADATKRYLEQVDVVLNRSKEAAQETSGFWQEAAKNMQDSMANFFFDAMEGKLSNLGDSFKKTIDRMVSNALAAQLAEKLFGSGFAGGKGGSDIGGWIGTALSWWSGSGGAGGANAAGGMKAGGGPVYAGHGYMVGEQGPEFFSPSVSGNITPNGKLGGQQVVQNFYISQPASRATQEQVAAQAQTGLMRAARRSN